MHLIIKHVLTTFVISLIFDKKKLNGLNRLAVSEPPLFILEKLYHVLYDSFLEATPFSFPQLLAGAKVSDVDNHQRSVLHMAVEGDFPTILSILLENAANPDLVDDNGNNRKCSQMSASICG